MKKEDIKVLIMILGLVILETVVFFVCKFSPIEPTLLESSFDNNLPFVSWFGILYCLWYIYLFLIPYLFYKKDRKCFFKYFSITIICIIIAAFVFILYPTTVNRNVNFENTNLIMKYVLKFIYFMDTPALCCLPSMHCVLSFNFIYLSLKVKDLKWYYKFLICVTSIGIAFSTLFIKQHVIWDVYAAIAVIILGILIDKFVDLDKFIEKKFDKFNLK